jgi:hypothetical protein
VSSVMNWLPPLFSIIASGIGTRWCVLMIWESETVKAWRIRRRQARNADRLDRNDVQLEQAVRQAEQKQRQDAIPGPGPELEDPSDG